MRASLAPWSVEGLGLDRSDIEDRSDNFLSLPVHTYFDPAVFEFELDAVFDVSPERNVPVLTDHLMNSRFVSAAARDGHTLRSNRFCSFQLFPGCQLIQHDDLLVLGRIVPTGAQSCRFIVHYLVERDADPGRVEAWIALWNRTYDEDTDAVERQQKGLCSGRVPRLRYVPAREQPALFINGLIREAYREALGEAPPLPAQRWDSFALPGPSRRAGTAQIGLAEGAFRHEA